MKNKITEEQGKLIMEIAKAGWNKSYRQFPYFRDDAIGFVTLQMCTAMKKYDKNKNVNLKTYLNTVANNSFKKFMRDEVYRHRDKYVDISISNDEGYTLSLEDIIGDFDVNYNNLEFKELMNRFDKYIEEKNRHQSRKTNLEELHYIIRKCDEGYTQVEIANTLKVSQNTIKKKIHKMRDIITEIKNN